MRKAATSLARQSYGIRRRQLSQASLGHQYSPVPITTLPNKIRVVTESTPGHFSSVGLYVDAGSRYEDHSTSGASHFLDRMAFKVSQVPPKAEVSSSSQTVIGQSTGSRSNADMSTAMDALGGQIMCSSSRESIMYQSSHFHAATPLALSLISDTVLNASFLPDELDVQRDAARYEIREVSAKPDMILPEVLHNVAYGGKTLGYPLLCPDDRIDAIDQGVLRGRMKDWYRPERMVIAGAGMRHEELVELTDKYFSSLKSAPSLAPQPTISRQANPSQSIPAHLLPAALPSLTKSLTRAASSYLLPTGLENCSIYTGGQRHIFDASQEFNHLYLAFEGVGIHDEDIYTLATMQVLLGGGGSFSAG
jgi:processing peptidase subunit alpha